LQAASAAPKFLPTMHEHYNTFAQLKKMGPMRRIEAAELMIAMSNHTTNYAPVTPNSDAAGPICPKTR
jgi:hypothetical protein